MKEHIIINKDRTVVVPDSVRKIGIQYDHKVNTLTFDCPRYADDNQSIDLSRMAIYINFSRNDKTKGSVAATNVFVDPDDPEIMHFDFIITRSVTLVNGSIICLVCAKSTDAEGVEVNHWNSELFNKLSVGEGMEAEEELTEEEIDYITSLLQEINTTHAEVADVDTRVEDLELNQEKQGAVSEVDLEAMTWTEGSYITGSGTAGSSSGYGISELVTIPKMSTLILDATGYQSDVAMIAKSDHTPLVTSVDGKTHYEYYTDEEIQVYISCKTTVAKSAKIVRNVSETLSDLERENSELKGDLVNVKDSMITHGFYTLKSSDMVKGTIDKNTGVESNSDNTIKSKEFIDVSKTESIIYTGIASASYYVRVAYYDENGIFIESTNGFLATNEPIKFVKPKNAKNMKFVIAYISLTDIDYIRPVIDFSKLMDADEIDRSIVKGMYKSYENNWDILEGKWVDIPTGQYIKFTDSRNSCTKNFLHAEKGDELILQSPLSFSIMLFSKADDTTCFYNSYKDGQFFTGYKFNSDCYFMLNFTNQIDLTAETKASDIVWTKNTVKSTQTVFLIPNADYGTIHVASAWASDEEKLGADYVCDGVNDGEELQQAIFDLRARGGGILKLSNERYIIDTLFDSGNPSVGKYGIFIPTNHYNVSLIKIEGVNFPNVIQPMYFGHCARIDMSQALYDSLEDNEIVNMIGVKPVIDKIGEVSRSSVGCTLSIENVAINIPAPQKKIIGVNCEYAYNMQLKGVHCGLTEYAGDPQTPNGKIINSNIDCIGIRTLYGYNWGSGYRIDDCNVRGWGLGFDISGEHLIMQNACARFVNTGFRFGHFGDDTMMSHPNTLINCCEEWLLHGMVFEGNGLGQAVNIIDFNIEDMTSNGWGRKTLATESVKGAYKGTLTYTTTKDSYKNSQEKFWADDGSGKNIITRDLNDKFSGTTSERPKYPQNNQQYFDTTINKMIYYINGNWVDAMGEVIS